MKSFGYPADTLLITGTALVVTCSTFPADCSTSSAARRRGRRRRGWWEANGDSDEATERRSDDGEEGPSSRALPLRRSVASSLRRFPSINFSSIARTSRGVRCRWAWVTSSPGAKPSVCSSRRSFSSLGGLGTRPVSISDSTAWKCWSARPVRRASIPAGGAGGGVLTDGFD